jgi:hypothetical protein
MKIISKKTQNDLHDYIVMSEQELASDQLKLIGGKTTEKELNYMFSQGAYNACKSIAKILKIKYNFLF